MDIEILLILQEFRSGIGGNLAAFFSKMTFLGEIPTVMLLMGIIYWSVSREIGTFLMLGWSGNRLLNGALKVTVCAYRPWIRDSRVIPYGDSMTTATGYSFPSGHSTNSASLYGGLMIRKDMRASLRIVMGLLVLLVPLSRLFLGVHTPQDVLAGTAAGLLVMWAALRVTGWLKENPGKEWIPALAGLVLAAAVAVYAGIKTYPEDYVDTVLIVDGMKMARDTFQGRGRMLRISCRMDPGTAFRGFFHRRSHGTESFESIRGDSGLLRRESDHCPPRERVDRRIHGSVHVPVHSDAVCFFYISVVLQPRGGSGGAPGSDENRA